MFYLHAQYADRLPIGLEKVIREVPADVVKAFYERWYRPQNMAGGPCLSESTLMSAKLMYSFLLRLLICPRSGLLRGPSLPDKMLLCGAVIAVGDFEPDAVVAMLTARMQGCHSRDPSPALPVPRLDVAYPLNYSDYPPLLCDSTTIMPLSLIRAPPVTHHALTCGTWYSPECGPHT